MILRRVGEYVTPRVVRFKSDGGFPLRGTRFKEVAMRRKCPGNVSAEMCFNFG